MASVHIKKVGEYLGRCVGMARVTGSVTQDFMTADLGICVVVATDLATQDIEDYCADHRDDALRDTQSRR